MARILRGEIYWADLTPTRGHEQAGRRPVVVVSHDIFNERSETVIAMAITGRVQRAGYPLNSPVPAGILPKESWVKVSQVRTLASERLGSLVGRLDEQSVKELVAALNELIG